MRRLVLALVLWLAGCHAILGYDEVEFLPQTNKVDVLLVIDNSIGSIMADKQEIFEIAIDALMERLLARVDDLHIGIVTTSLGSLGGDACDDATQNDRGRLVARDRDGNSVPTYQSLGFLKWDPQKTYDPPGIADPATLRTQLWQMVLGTGGEGCPFEATLESFYRFLVDPDPYENVELDAEQKAQLVGTDRELLAQRAAFLRPDSLVIVLLLTDENDCSLRAGGQYWQVAQRELPERPGQPFHVWPGRTACAIDPDDACCTSCALDPPEHCESEECAAPLDEMSDPIDLRCFQPKRRFGIDFLQPIDRYVSGLTAQRVADRHGALRDNPLFIGGRHRWHVVVAAMVGVPWQDIARRADNGEPDLLRGLDAQGEPVGGLQSAAELREGGTWDVILGDPSAYFDEPNPKLPTDPLMRESIEPRSGVDASINGGEHSFYKDLQYACRIELDEPKDCAVVDPEHCYCDEMPPESSLCEGTTQVYAAAYPGIRQLELMQKLGDQAVVGSICPAQGIEPSAPSGYQPTVDALLDTIEPRLTP
ncbi:MAG TPA: hypothetical protein VFB62_00505 [Polyangiaceae bacterium]|nr:hypothetical protein [Polyangiaceae bacterium]